MQQFLLRSSGCSSASRCLKGRPHDFARLRGIGTVRGASARSESRPDGFSHSRDGYMKNDEKGGKSMMDARRLSMGVMLASVGAALGSLYLVSQDGKGKFEAREYMSVPEVEISRKFSTSGSAGASVTIEAFSVGEQISQEVLMQRYAFDENDLKLDEKLVKEDDDEDGPQDGKSKATQVRKTRRNQMQVIGRGAYGRVVSALNRSTGRKVAMKVVPHSAMSADALLDEIEVLKRVRGHDNIIHLIDVVYCGGKFYVVTELCEGGEVLDHLIAHGPFTEKAASLVIHQVASALGHIHKCGFVHLDLKPENLVFTRKDRIDDCRIVDFGMAMKISEIEGNLHMVKGDKGLRVGTLAYWAPEQVASVIDRNGSNFPEFDRVPVTTDPRECDMWALGVVLYIMLLGCHPFDPQGKGNERDMAKAILKGDYRFDIHGEKLKLSQDAKDLISGLLRPNPTKRSTVNDVMNHPFLVKLSRPQKLSHDETLPTSWTRQGYHVDRNRAVDQLVENETDARLKPFNTPRAAEAFARVLLMAVAANGWIDDNEYIASNKKEKSINPNQLFRQAFYMFDIEPDGYLKAESLDYFLKALGDDFLVTHRARSSLVSKSSGPGVDYEEFVAYLRKLDCVTRTFDANECVFRQGSIPQGIYVLLSGKARLEYRDPKDDAEDVKYSYAKLDPGSIFGEAALIRGQNKRSATVRCTENSEVLFIPKEMFLGAIAGSPALNEVIFKLAMKQQARRLHQLVEFLKPNRLIVKHLAPGQILFRQGEPGDYLYLVREGLIGSHTSAPSSRARGAEEMSIKLAERGPGDLVGTSAGMGGGGLRYSTSKCITPTTVLGIPADELTRLRKEEPVFRFYLENLVQTRKEFWQSQVADVERGVSEPQLLPLLLQAADNDVNVVAMSNEDETSPTVDERGPTEVVRKASLAGKVSAPSELEEEEVATSQVKESQQQPSFVMSYLNPYNWWARKSAKAVKFLSQESQAKRMASFETYAKAVSRMKRLDFKAGEIILEKGKELDKFYIVDSGTVLVEYVSRNGCDSLRIAQLGPGDHFGEQALVQSLPKTAMRFRCLSDTQILAMSKEKFEDLVGDGTTDFAVALDHAMRMRQHRWVRNLLKLAKEGMSTRRNRVSDQKLKEGMTKKRNAQRHRSLRSTLIERIDDDRKGENTVTDFIDRDHIELNRESGAGSSASKGHVIRGNKNANGVGKQELQSQDDGDGVKRTILQPGDILFRKGDSISGLYMIHRGEMDMLDVEKTLFVTGPGKGGKLLAGDTVGLEQMDGESVHQFTAYCTKPNTVVSKIPVETLEILIEENDYVSQQLRRLVRRSVPMGEIEKRTKMDLLKHGASYSSLMKDAVVVP